MHGREIFSSLEAHLTKRQITVITGMRRVGKTTALKYLLQKAPGDNKLYMDLERVEYRQLLRQSSYKEVESALTAEGLDLGSPAVIALDEIQLVPDSTSILKYLYDTFPIKFIVSGSSSFYLKNQFSESLAGRKRIFEMHPLSFQEVLDFKGVAIDLHKFAGEVAFNPTLYRNLIAHYLHFLRYGGFPEVVLAETNSDREAYLKDIINSSIELDIKLLSDFSASGDLYNLMKLLASRTGSKTDFSKIGSALGIDRRKVKNYLLLLEQTYFIIQVKPFTTNADREISLATKIYFSDTGLLNSMHHVAEGSVLENAVAIQLNRLGQLQYYAKKSGQEIDFVSLEEAIEVKATPISADLGTVRDRAAGIGLPKATVVGLHPPKDGFKEFVWASMAGIK